MQKSTIQIRSALPGEEEILCALIHELAVYEGTNTEAQQATRESLRRFGFEENPYFFTEFAEIDGRVVGYALYFYAFAANRGLPILYLEDLYVKPEYRNQGIGVAFLKRLAKFAHDRQCCRLQWHVYDWNRSAIDFYQELGCLLKKDLVQVRLEKDDLLKLI